MLATKMVRHLLNELWDRTKCERLCLSGGFFMNSVFNGFGLEGLPFKEVFIPHAPTDAGNAIGAALFVTHCLRGMPRVHNTQSPYLGPSISAEEALRAVARRGLRAEPVANLPEKIAELIASGELVAVAVGASEFGDRALGHRSILGDPRNPAHKEAINAVIKYRQSYRPVAPAVLAEHVEQYFNVPQGFRADYMERVVAVQPAWREKIPACVHVDGSGRVQTVQRSLSPFFADVLESFGKQTGLPMLLNTSFNVNGEPMVLTAEDALSTFYNSGLRCLALPGLLVKKA
jgi:carbamoyltransferase